MFLLFILFQPYIKIFDFIICISLFLSFPLLLFDHPVLLFFFNLFFLTLVSFVFVYHFMFTGVCFCIYGILLYFI